MAVLDLRTPGVYIEEKDAFPRSVVGVPTAVPVFIGYTENANQGGKSVLNKPVRISSLAEFAETFGGSPKALFEIAAATVASETEFISSGTNYQLTQTGAEALKTRCFLAQAIRLFYSNGGGTCYIVSVGTYGGANNGKIEVTKAALLAGIEPLIGETVPTMLLIPESVLLPNAEFQEICQNMLAHCGKMMNRIALFDVQEGYKPTKTNVIETFRGNVGNNFLSYGTAYYPWLNTSIFSNNDVDFTNIFDTAELVTILKAEAVTLAGDNAKRKTDLEGEAEKITTYVAQLTTAPAKPEDKIDATKLSQTLLALFPTYKMILQTLRNKLNVMPPAAAMAGIYTMVDTQRGVWKAPANVSMTAVVSPTVNLTHDDQADLNVTLTGKSVNAIRSFVGEGTVVWGARTLDGNSQDWRYVNVRRTLIYIEQSIKIASKAFVFEPNTASTWLNVQGTIEGFLMNVWKQGGLVGSSPKEAYEVLIGLGATMTPTDILDGKMNITIKVAVSRPAEFIVITFQQKMQES
jgi:uncharacterized protein